MKIAMISCAVVACLSLPAFAAKVETAQRIVTQPHLLVITADVEPDTLPGVIAWAATAAPYSSLAVPLLDNGGTSPVGQRVALQTTAGVGGGSFEVADAQALNGCAGTIPAAGYHCAIIARVSLK